MLTKEERAAIAERLRSTYYITNSTLFKALTGEEELIENDQVRELCVIARVIFDLCNTSNMIELPRDKDGEVIHVGDVVYAGDREFTVDGFIFSGSNVTVRAIHTKLSALNFYKPYELKHKKQVTIELLVERFERVLAKGQMSYWVVGEISDIVDQLKKLGDSDD